VESLRGQLLVSSPSLVDPNFRKTVVLIAHHDDDGAMGLVLSRPSSVAAVEAVPLLEGLPGSDAPVFVGGPVQPQAFMVLAEFGDLADSVAPIFDHVGFMSADAEPEELSILRVRLFAGYAGWGAGQLEAELEEPAWLVVPADQDDPFVDDPEVLWRSAVNRAGVSASLMKSMPFDPGLN
jgi:putative transcriptional regulator